MSWIKRLTDKLAFGKSPMWLIRRLGDRILDVIVFGPSQLWKRKKKKDEDS